MHINRFILKKILAIHPSLAFKLFTHYWKAKNNNLYLFCYEFGFMERTENGKAKYILIQWQPCMR
ncbi:hypothetical protein C900_04854 [Fulvivirga imtechensis AK7]|uniref:Uncharacterized protein n=1 Tax=Fulvivirga imtechensis AK7 TaxID=1237149 RepID=L8JQ60_9BACT|nr:hypothetical protein C900_04854 [Fulvivirga imtechensis AK7]